jgi:hypothetical protein
VEVAVKRAITNDDRGLGKRRLGEELPETTWVSLADALRWLIFGRVDAARSVEDIADAERSAWQLLCHGGSTGDIAFSGIPHAPSQVLDASRLGRAMTDDERAVDPLYFQTRLIYPAGLSGDEPHVLRIAGASRQRPRTAQANTVLAAQAWSQVKVKRDDLVRYAQLWPWQTPMEYLQPRHSKRSAKPQSSDEAAVDHLHAGQQRRRR